MPASVSPLRTGILILVTILGALSACSCGKKATPVPVHPVSGKVFYQKKPATGALVIFHPKQEEDATKNMPRPRGVVKEDGSFKVSTFADNDGAPVGDYVVTIEWRKTSEDAEREGPDLLQGRYADRSSSFLRAKVNAGDNALPPFDLP